jgi:hypothetical protein
VTASSPVEGATDVAPTLAEVRLTFDEPMDSATGALVAPAGVTVGAARWEGSIATFPLSGLAHGTSYALRLQGFRDVAGNALAATALGDGALDFTTAAAPPPGDTTPPRVTASTPADGADDVYRTEFHVQEGTLRERKVLSVTFDEPMDTALASLQLAERTGEQESVRAVEGVWSADGRTLTVTLAVPEGAEAPLTAGGSAYRLDLRGLRDVAGNAVAADALGDGALGFTTAPADATLEHACAHTVYGPFGEVTAAPVGGFPPGDVSVTHTLFTASLPGAAAPHAGDLTSWPGEEGEPFLVYLGQDVPLTVVDEPSGEALPSTQRALPPVCPGLVSEVRFTHGPESMLYRLGPSPARQVTLILERAG